jgi:hypothetical protein
MTTSNGSAAMTLAKSTDGTASIDAPVLEQVLVDGDLAKLTPKQRVNYYSATCESLGLNPLTRPFQYITFQGKLTLYARKDATEQLGKHSGVSTQIMGKERIEDIYIVTARATTSSGRFADSTGAVPIGGLKGEALANAFMKAETKAKRRATLSVCGLGWLDETEVDSVPGARRVNVSVETGEIEGEPMPPAEIAKAAQAVAEAARDWEPIVTTLEEALKEADSVRIKELSDKATPEFKFAPSHIRKRVAAAFTSARNRVQPPAAE